MKIQILKWILIFKFYRLINNVGAINSMTEDGMHVGLIDLDGYAKEPVFSEMISRIRMAQLKYGLADAYVLQSSKNNLHIVFLDKHTFGFWIDVCQFLGDKATKQHQIFSVKRNRFVLRITEKGDIPKPKLLAVVKRAFSSEKSYPHWRYL